jgi:hypothetical protein
MAVMVERRNNPIIILTRPLIFLLSKEMSEVGLKESSKSD